MSYLSDGLLKIATILSKIHRVVMAKKPFSTSKLVKTKIKLLNTFMLFLLAVLIFSVREVMDFGIFLIYISTCILVLHIWLGAYYAVKFLKSEENLRNYILDASILICLMLGIINFYRIIAWGVLFALLFILVMVKYRIAYLSSKERKIKDYLSKKIRNEFVVAPLFAIFAWLAYAFKGSNMVILSLQIFALFFHVFFAVWMICIKKVYLSLGN